MMIAKKFGTTLVSLSLATGLMMAAMPQAMAVEVPRNEYGMYTVKCQVHEFGAGNAIVGFVFGNDDKDPRKAQKEANAFVSRLGGYGKVTKRHCKAQHKYTASGAYDSDMNPV